jgi:magnesium transporter
MLDIISNDKVTWIDIVNATPEDLNYLRKSYNFHDLDLDDCLSKVQRPKLEEYDDYSFVVLHFPVICEKGKNNRFLIEELDFFWGENFLVTIHSSKMNKLTDLFLQLKNTPSKFNKYLSQGVDYLLYKLLHKLVLQIFPIMNQISYDIDWIDNNYDKKKAESVIEKISALRRNIIFLQSSLKPQRNIFMAFEKMKNQQDKNMDVYWGDIGDYLGKIVDMAEDHQELLEGLYTSIDTLLTYRTNKIMKILAMITVISLPLTAISGFYGMNVQLPFQASANAVWGIAVAMGVCVIAVILLFKINKY